ncbi:hypothetical protein [Tahibacter aquaticus]|uniref:hypothetical protein n=1 Tax=Tahibacter aquaticus TaxID=520092 RepID=UPI001061B602|nr:hypothetical protein [Tahibacter aquaticus]
MFLVAVTWSARDTLAQTWRQSNLYVLLGLLPLWAALHLLTPVYAHLLLRLDGLPLPYATALRIHVARLPARYLPGGLWHTVTKAADFSVLGVAKENLTLLVFLENHIPFALALTLGSAALQISNGATAPLATGLALGLLLLALPPLALNRLAPLAHLRLGWRRYTALLVVSSVFWCVAAGTFASYWHAFELPAHAPLQIAGSYLVSWALGFAAVVAPQGIGVFETSIALLLNGSTPLARLLAMAAGFRVFCLVADLLVYALYLVWRCFDAVRLRPAQNDGEDSRRSPP